MTTTPPAEPNVDELAQRLQAALGDSYAVEKPLGAGGFAVVYLVRDLSLKRNLAVKVLSPDLITSKTVLERFRREAETVAQLSHPNIVPLHFIGQKDDLLYLAMACIDGGSVADRLDKIGPLPIADVRRIVSEVASALAHAHKRGVIHRDIKPQNVLTDSESGRSLVTDFGIARTADSSLTATGMFVGTPAYLAPEQVTGEPSDHRADIYALGVMAYELLAGQAPFIGATPTAVLMKRLAGPPEPITSVRKDTPEELAAVIDTCLASDPEQRFQSATDIVAVLGGDLTRTPTLSGGRTVKRPPKKKSPVALIAGVAAVAAAVAAFIIIARGNKSTSSAAVSTADSSMVTIAGGAYTIGFAGNKNASPRHQVPLPAFLLDKTEVTEGAYADYVREKKAVAPWTGAGPSPQLPVARVSWSEAARYCEWRHPAGGRLPSEEEWEAAARGTASRTYPWGNTFDKSRANTAVQGSSGPIAVGSYPAGATPEGVQDMIGNVWEWTSSPMSAYPGAPAMPDSMSQFRVIRGGAYNTGESIATGWFRGYNRPSTNPEDLKYTGFRCAKTAARGVEGR